MEHHLDLGQAVDCVQTNESSELPVLGVLVKEWEREIDLLIMLPEVPVGVMEVDVYDAQPIPAQDGRVPGAQRAVCFSMSYQGVKGVAVNETKVLWR